MRHRVLTLILGVFALYAASLPQSRDDDEFKALSGQVLREIAPKTESCEDAAFPEECADATRAARAINKAFETYGISSLGERVGLVAYMLFESDDFKYNRNHYPGRPGQGTRMMAMPSFVKSYAESVAGPDAVAKAEAAGGDAGLDAVLRLANCNDEKSFGSAAWFLSTQCTGSVRDGLATRGKSGWHDFLTTCVNTTVTAERDTRWLATAQVMNSEK
ncbi:hypothetical protein COCHEDRAFT_1115009 [Bipolaris maydis C5]|uniref:Uncharacterized protein n=1 Tax=Cochliobolus heterostrophus (strain C5 / ATCC 48332 / race O) TaxID=701091 RepID=M2UF20_COCH5|nr:hypothetical protein COCHEDRAFT_1115009 [Bipolaris maydis C5]KAJ5051171.1 hypothetical protein J3E74DRAFT_229851 [Bipolaris maydis]KAJ5052655.1 hypothetical protein J3E74DRAFT_433118 [Bipolaris maydis]KAJ6192324.1 hypothetical protein J3E72DRAFT_399363 [Bipolaris maydis]KAJ6203807.1 hypothetical protein PSV09DRAFT_1115009 [Bipolaris maydis]